MKKLKKFLASLLSFSVLLTTLPVSALEVSDTSGVDLQSNEDDSTKISVNVNYYLRDSYLTKIATDTIQIALPDNEKDSVKADYDDSTFKQQILDQAAQDTTREVSDYSIVANSSSDIFGLTFAENTDETDFTSVSIGRSDEDVDWSTALNETFTINYTISTKAIGSGDSFEVYKAIFHYADESGNKIADDEYVYYNTSTGAVSFSNGITDFSGSSTISFNPYKRVSDYFKIYEHSDLADNACIAAAEYYYNRNTINGFSINYSSTFDHATDEVTLYYSANYAKVTVTSNFDDYNKVIYLSLDNPEATLYEDYDSDLYTYSVYKADGSSKYVDFDVTNNLVYVKNFNSLDFTESNLIISRTAKKSYTHNIYAVVDWDYSNPIQLGSVGTYDYTQVKTDVSADYTDYVFDIDSATVQIPLDTSYSGYFGYAWETAVSSSTNPVTSSTKVSSISTSSTNLYLFYESTQGRTVTFVTNTTYGSFDGASSNTETYSTDNKKIVTPEEPTPNSGYIFYGWSNSSSDLGLNDSGSTKSKEINLSSSTNTYYAVFRTEEKLTVVDHFMGTDLSEQLTITRGSYGVPCNVSVSDWLSGNQFESLGKDVNFYNIGILDSPNYYNNSLSAEDAARYDAAGLPVSASSIGTNYADYKYSVSGAWKTSSSGSTVTSASGNGYGSSDNTSASGNKYVVGYIVGDTTIDYYYWQIPETTVKTVYHYGYLDDDGNFVGTDTVTSTSSVIHPYATALGNTLTVNYPGYFYKNTDYDLHRVTLTSSSYQVLDGSNSWWYYTSPANASALLISKSVSPITYTLYGDFADNEVNAGEVSSTYDYNSHVNGAGETTNYYNVFGETATLDIYMVTQPTITVKVYDELYDDNDNLISSTLRTTDTYSSGATVCYNSFNYSSFKKLTYKNADGNYTQTSPSFSKQLTSDTVIRYIYKANEVYSSTLTVKFKVVDANGNPISGVAINGYETDETGFSGYTEAYTSTYTASTSLSSTSYTLVEHKTPVNTMNLIIDDGSKVLSQFTGDVITALDSSRTKYFYQCSVYNGSAYYYNSSDYASSVTYTVNSDVDPSDDSVYIVTLKSNRSSNQMKLTVKYKYYASASASAYTHTNTDDYAFDAFSCVTYLDYPESYDKTFDISADLAKIAEDNGINVSDLISYPDKGTDSISTYYTVDGSINVDLSDAKLQVMLEPNDKATKFTDSEGNEFSTITTTQTPVVTIYLTNPSSYIPNYTTTVTVRYLSTDGTELKTAKVCSWGVDDYSSKSYYLNTWINGYNCILETNVTTPLSIDKYGYLSCTEAPTSNTSTEIIYRYYSNDIPCVVVRVYHEVYTYDEDEEEYGWTDVDSDIIYYYTTKSDITIPVSSDVENTYNVKFSYASLSSANKKLSNDYCTINDTDSTYSITNIPDSGNKWVYLYIFYDKPPVATLNAYYIDEDAYKTQYGTDFRNATDISAETLESDGVLLDTKSFSFSSTDDVIDIYKSLDGYKLTGCRDITDKTSLNYVTDPNTGKTTGLTCSLKDASVIDGNPAQVLIGYKVVPKLTVNYVDTEGKAIAESETYDVDGYIFQNNMYKDISNYAYDSYSCSSTDLTVSIYNKGYIYVSSLTDTLSSKTYTLTLTYKEIKAATVTVRFTTELRETLGYDALYTNTNSYYTASSDIPMGCPLTEDYDPVYVATGVITSNLADGVTLSGVDTFKISKELSDITYSVAEPTANTTSTITVYIEPYYSAFTVQYFDTDGNSIKTNAYYSTYEESDDPDFDEYDAYVTQNIVASIEGYECTGYSYPYGEAVVTKIDSTNVDDNGIYSSVVVSIPEIVPGKSDTIRLTYKKVETKEPEETRYALKVYEKYEDTDGSEEKTNIKVDTTVVEGYAYSYTANCPDGYEVVGSSSYSGVVNDNTTLTFTYRKIAYTLKVYEKYEYADGTEEKTDTKVDTTVTYGYVYSYAANCPEGYTVIGSTSYTGTVSSNTTLTFIYRKIKECTITVQDVYYSVDGDKQDTKTRLTETKKSGETYSYSALTPVPDGYVLTSDSSYSGTVSDDLVIEFSYYEDAARFVTVTGYITYADGTPIANKRIEIHSTPRYTVTDSNGYYSIDYVEVGTHTFTVFASDDSSDSTPLVTCELSVAKTVDADNQDKIEVTYKATGCEVSTDTDTINVLKIDAVLPVYEITVVDEYYDGTTLTSSSTRCKDSYKAGDTYTYNALSVSGYDVTGVVQYSETCTGSKTLVFKYTKKTETPKDDPKDEPTTEKPKDDPKDEPTTEKPKDEPETEVSKDEPETEEPVDDEPVIDEPVEDVITYRLRVVDNYYDSNLVLQDSVVRVSNLVTKGTSYSYKALNVDGYKVSGKSKYSGVVDGNITLTFNYIKDEELESYNLKVIDTYYTNDGSLESQDVRFDKVVEEGYSYSFEAVKKAGYTATGVTSVSGVVLNDTVIEFTYKKDAEVIDTKYTVTVIDRYIIGEKLYKYNADFIQSLGDEVTVSKVGNNYEVSVARIITDDYNVTTEAVTRCVDTYSEGATYQYSSLSAIGWTLVGESSYSGVVNDNIVLVFSYEKGFASVDDVPLADLPDLTATTTFNNQPKTGSEPFKTALPIVIFFGTLLASAFVLKKKYEDD